MRAKAFYGVLAAVFGLAGLIELHAESYRELLVYGGGEILRMDDSGESDPFPGKAWTVDVLGDSVYVHYELTITIYDVAGKKQGSIKIPPEVEYFVEFIVLPDKRLAFFDNRKDVVYFVDEKGTHLKTVSILEEPGKGWQNMRGVVVDGQLIVSQNEKKELIAIDLDTYEVSVFYTIPKTLMRTPGTLAHSGGVFYLANRGELYSFTKESKKPRRIAKTPRGNITGIGIAPDHLYVVVNHGGALYKIDRESGDIRKIKDGLSFPLGLFFLKVIGSASIASDPIPDGYMWVRCGSSKMGLLKPEAWFQSSNYEGNQETHVISAEDKREAGGVGTGLTLKIIKAGRKKNFQATAYAAGYIQQLCEKNEVVLEAFSEPTAEPFDSFGCQVRMTKAGASKIVHYLVLANDKTGTLFLYQFEAPEERWDEAWKIGEVLMQKVWVDKQI